MMRTGMWSVAVLWLAGAAASAQPSPAQGEADLSGPFVKASISTAGPYGQSWYLTLTPDGEASLQIFYTTAPSGSLLARFQLASDSLKAMRAAVDSEHFFDLPETVAPRESPLHMPDLRLTVTVGGRSHKVNLYNPDELKNDPRAKRFLAVWKRVFESLPLHPSW